MNGPSTGPNGSNLGGIAGRAPSGDAKGYIRNCVLYEDDSAEFTHTMQFMFRPPLVREQVSVAYDRMRVMGMSHQYQSYSHTENFQFSFELYENALMMMKVLAVEKTLTGGSADEGSKTDLQLLAEMLEQDRRFLEALTLPYETPTGIIGGSPPPCILCIPGIVSARCRLTSMSWTAQDCDVEGNLKAWSAQVTFEEAPMARITMNDQLAAGTFRTWGF